LARNDRVEEARKTLETLKEQMRILSEENFYTFMDYKDYNVIHTIYLSQFLSFKLNASKTENY